MIQIRENSNKAENQQVMTTNNSRAASYQLNSAATTILDDLSSSVMILPMNSIPTTSSTPVDNAREMATNPDSVRFEQEQQCLLSSTKMLKHSTTDFDTFIDQRLQATLEKNLRNHSELSTITNHKSRQQQKSSSVTLTKSGTEKLINNLDFTKQVCNLEQYKKQVRIIL